MTRSAPPAQSPPDGSDREAGLALVAVLVVLTILSIAAASLTLSTSVGYRLAQNSISGAKAEALIEAGVSRAILALLDPRPEKRWRVDGTSYDFEFAGVRLKVRIEDELGKIDVNRADSPLLTSLFEAALVDPQTAAEMADRIMDWREPGDLHRLNGAKDPEYRSAGYAYGPRNGPFQTVDEVKLVLGMTPALFARIAPALTVYSGSASIDPRTAPREALLALPAMTPEIVAAALAEREGPSGGASPDGSIGGRAFTIRVSVGGAEGEVVVRFTEKPTEPYWVLAWKTHAPRVISDASSK